VNAAAGGGRLVLGPSLYVGCDTIGRFTGDLRADDARALCGVEVNAVLDRTSADCGRAGIALASPPLWVAPTIADVGRNTDDAGDAPRDMLCAVDGRLDAACEPPITGLACTQSTTQVSQRRRPSSSAKRGSLRVRQTRQVGREARTLRTMVEPMRAVDGCSGAAHPLAATQSRRAP
jgi:hypothetical protein